MSMYAEISDLEAGWRDIASDEIERAEELILRASAYLDTIVEKYDIDVNEKADALRIVCCDLVQRKMENASASAVLSVTQTAGAFSETTSYGNRGSASWRLYPEDKQLLGIKARGIAVLQLAC